MKPESNLPQQDCSSAVKSGRYMPAGGTVEMITEMKECTIPLFQSLHYTQIWIMTPHIV